MIGIPNISLLTTKKQNLNIVFHLYIVNDKLYFTLQISTVVQPVLVKTTIYAVNLFSYRIVHFLVSLMFYKPLHTFVLLTINEDMFSS